MVKKLASSLVACLMSAAAPVAAADIILPAVPTGGILRAQFSLSAAGFGPLANIPVTLSVPGSCGTFDGGEEVTVTTDATGTAGFTFHAGNLPGECRIEGRNGTTSAAAYTMIYRPQDVLLTAAERPLQSTYVNSVAFFTVTAKVGPTPLYGLPFSVDPPPASGPSGTLQNVSTMTDTNGNAGVQIRTNGTAGIYDVIARAGGASRVLRIWQSAQPELRPTPARSMVLGHAPQGHGAYRLSIVDAPQSCLIVSADYFPDSTQGEPPAGTSGFPVGKVQLSFQGCLGATVGLALEYPQALPLDSVFLVNAPSPSRPEPWAPVPFQVNGNTVTFTLVDEGLGDRDGTPFGQIVTVAGLAARGQPVPRGQIPRIQDLWWAGQSENGWGMSLVQNATGNVFTVIYGYDEGGRPTWWTASGGSWDRSGRLLTGSLAYPRGTPWYAFDPAIFAPGDTIGPVTIDFTGDAAAALDVSIAGMAMRKSMQRLAFGGVGTAQRLDLGGLWWGGVEQSGWGVAVLQQQGTLFSIWYTYDERNLPTWFMMPGGTWTNGSTYEGRMFRTRGSPLLGRAYDPAQLQVIDVGPYRLRFNGDEATLDYSIEGRTGVLPLKRYQY